MSFKGKGPALDPADFVSEEEWNRMDDNSGAFANLPDLNTQFLLAVLTDLTREYEGTSGGSSSPGLTSASEASDTHVLSSYAQAFRSSPLGIDSEQDHSFPTTANRATIYNDRGDSTSVDREVESDNDAGDEGHHDDGSNNEPKSQSPSSDSSSETDDSEFVDHFGGFSEAFKQARVVPPGSGPSSSSSSYMDGRIQPFTEEGEQLLRQLRHHFSMPDDMTPAAMATFFGRNPDLLRAVFLGRVSHPRWQFWDADNLYELHTDPAGEADNARASRCFQKLQWVDHDTIYTLTVARAYLVPGPDNATRLVMEKLYLKRFRGKESPFIARRFLASGDAEQQAAEQSWQQQIAKREKRPGSLLRREVLPEDVM